MPLEGLLLAILLPDGSGSMSVQNIDHLFIKMFLRLQLGARRDFADVAIVRGARGIVIDVDAAAAAARPVSQLAGAQVRHIMAADDLEPFRASFKQEMENG